VTRIAFLAFPAMTFLDLVGAYDALRRVPALGIDRAVTHSVIATCSPVRDEEGLAITPHALLGDLDAFDLLYVPGGQGTRALMRDAAFLDRLRAWGTERPIASVCTGALLLGAAGLLAGRRATTHHRAFDLLRPLCAEVVEDERIVVDGPVTTAAGVTASIDLGLHLVERGWGADARAAVATRMEYRG